VKEKHVKQTPSKITLFDRLAIASITFSACITAGGWLRALAVERRTERLMHAVYAQPTAELTSAIAAGNAADGSPAGDAIAKDDSGENPAAATP
jgi:hypothetical protein